MNQRHEDQRAPRVSVLMGVYNTGRFVEEACQSVLRQSLSDLELVVVDDGSSDDGPERLRALAVRDPRLRLFTRENRGLIATRNELLERSRAALVAWMDSDDRSPPDRLAKQVARLDAEPELVCLGGAVVEVDPEGDPIRRVEYPRSHDEIMAGARLGGLMTFGTTMMRRQAALDVGGFREPFRMGEDFDLMLRLAEVGRVANLEDVLLEYRQRENSTSWRLSSRWAVYRDGALALARERSGGGCDRLQRGEPLELKFEASPEAETAQRWKTHWWWARQALAFGYSATAAKHARRAFAIAPWKLASWKLGARVLLTELRLVAREPGAARLRDC